MRTIVLQVYERLGQNPSLMYSREGKILNPTQTLKVFEFEYANRIVPNIGVMGWCHVEFIDAYDSPKAGEINELPIEQKLALKKLLTDKLEGAKPAPPISPLEAQNQMLLERLARLEANQIPVKSPPKKLAARSHAKKTPGAKPEPTAKSAAENIAEIPSA